MYGGLGVSAPSLHRESTDSLIQVNQKFFKFKKGEYRDPNMHKKYRRQDRDPGWIGDITASLCIDICTSTRKTC